ncbi:MAG TPA: damage-inducible protein CinA [Gammaproteobacteria bacterium]|jgi:nicotinamide-nucleotide amidase|nr:damage-inducible protein CinA [Gammaproteobacteria bacterium]HAE73487.1 damage-inducible protein CinA [Gammaproteobacteria bacterium]HAG48115.1 damage-inducible protein CinA [Gammaproteobacteria bacterium]HAO38318.1 damage-inducible protein CinA [Gammaproteobacteria bacterium]HAO45053.1 damage-inducible protein CinA [Gammaproteobacteria bacterium]
MKIQTLSQLLTDQSLTLSVAESCTGGNLSALLTSVSGSSTYFDRGYITYSNQAKMDMLDVDVEILEQFGAVSEQTAFQMVNGLVQNSHSDIAVSITGIAGPTGGTVEKPVGMVCFGFYVKDKHFVKTQHFSGDRETVVASSVDFVIQTLVDELSA